MADVVITLLAAIDWVSFFFGIAAFVILVGAVLGALGQIGRAWAWAMQRFRPPPRVELERLRQILPELRDQVRFVEGPRVGSVHIGGRRAAVVDPSDEVAAAHLHSPDVLRKLDDAGGEGEINLPLVVELGVLGLNCEELAQFLVGGAASGLQAFVFRAGAIGFRLAAWTRHLLPANRAVQRNAAEPGDAPRRLP